MIGDWISEMQDNADFLNTKINNSVILQMMAHILGSVGVTLFEGIPDDKMKMLVLELMRFCEHGQHFSHVVMHVVESLASWQSYYCVVGCRLFGPASLALVRCHCLKRTPKSGGCSTRCPRSR